eukprot:scaffold24658_cov113-Isochrysis_galbana.AAC.3
MRRDTFLSPGGLALPPFSLPPFTFTVPPGARPIISGMHGCGGWLGLVHYVGPGWRYGGGPRHGVGRCGVPLTKRGGGGRAHGLAPISPYSLRRGLLFKVPTVTSRVGSAGGPSPRKPMVASMSKAWRVCFRPAKKRTDTGSEISSALCDQKIG